MVLRSWFVGLRDHEVRDQVVRRDPRGVACASLGAKTLQGPGIEDLALHARQVLVDEQHRVVGHGLGENRELGVVDVLAARRSRRRADHHAVVRIEEDEARHRGELRCAPNILSARGGSVWDDVRHGHELPRRPREAWACRYPVHAPVLAMMLGLQPIMQLLTPLAHTVVADLAIAAVVVLRQPPDHDETLEAQATPHELEQEVVLVDSYHVRSEDCLVNQVLRAGLALGARLATDAELSVPCRRLEAQLGETVGLVSLDRATFTRLAADQSRLTRAYRPALELVHLLADSSGIGLDRGEEGAALPGFLFDMNHFFQRLLSRFLHDALPGYVVSRRGAPLRHDALRPRPQPARTSARRSRAPTSSSGAAAEWSRCSTPSTATSGSTTCPARCCTSWPSTRSVGRRRATVPGRRGCRRQRQPRHLRHPVSDSGRRCPRSAHRDPRPGARPRARDRRAAPGRYERAQPACRSAADRRLG